MYEKLCVQVGILDVDLCGPSIPRMLSVGRSDVHQCDSGWVPVYTDAQKSLALMSIGFLMEDPDEAVVWRGPKKTGTLFYTCTKTVLIKTCGGKLWSIKICDHDVQLCIFIVALHLVLPALIGQFVSDVAWGDLDVLLVDTPPGTSDEHLAVLENLKKHRVDGAILVTTPQVHIRLSDLPVYQ